MNYIFKMKRKYAMEELGEQKFQMYICTCQKKKKLYGKLIYYDHPN